MFHKKTLITLAVLGLVLSAGIASTYAFGGNAWRAKVNLTPEQIEQRQSQSQAIQQAIENNDYEAWRTLMQQKQDLMAEKEFAPKVNILEIIDSQEKFDKLVQAWQAMQSGDYETAKAIQEELGFPKIPGLWGLKGKGFGQFMRNHKFVDTNGDGVCDNLDLEQ
jgi:hypothetical protein